MCDRDRGRVCAEGSYSFISLEEATEKRKRKSRKSQQLTDFIQLKNKRVSERK